VSELSSEYFQLIPQKNFVYERLRPLDRDEDYRKQVKLIVNLLDFEVSTKMMLGAMYRKNGNHAGFLSTLPPPPPTLFRGCARLIPSVIMQQFLKL
jgi:hypothetical protein